MSEKLNWAILGTGSIAKKFAEGLPLCGSGELVAVGSRTQETADAFAAEFGGKGFDSYEAAIQDPKVDAVYISLPHHLHAEWTIKCAEAGKHILCEKPFALGADEARSALKAVKEHDVFFMEAFMYRCHPQTIALKQLLNDRVIGTPMVMHSQFGYNTKRGGTHFRADRKLGGGALMDVGCYCTSMSLLVAGQEPSRAVYSAQLSETGYDSYGSGLLEFPNGLIATFGTGMHCQMRNYVEIFGENGSILVTDPWFCNGQLVVQLHGRPAEEIQVPKVPHLWGNQSTVVAQLLDKRHAVFMTWKETMVNTALLESLLKSVKKMD